MGADELQIPIRATAWSRYLSNTLRTLDSDDIPGQDKKHLQENSTNDTRGPSRLEYRLRVSEDGERCIYVAGNGDGLDNPPAE